MPLHGLQSGPAAHEHPVITLWYALHKSMRLGRKLDAQRLAFLLYEVASACCSKPLIDVPAARSHLNQLLKLRALLISMYSQVASKAPE